MGRKAQARRVTLRDELQGPVRRCFTNLSGHGDDLVSVSTALRDIAQAQLQDAPDQELHDLSVRVHALVTGADVLLLAITRAAGELAALVEARGRDDG
jgi:hypothetical protein